MQFRIPVGVAYGSDTDKVTACLMAVAKANPHVLTDPAPRVFFDSYGESALNFELGIWAKEMMRSPRSLRSSINFAIDKAFREAGIEVPFPQRDLHVRSGSLEVRAVSSNEDKTES